MDLTSTEAAARLGIAAGALRQIETYNKPVSLQLAYRAERLYKVVDHDLTVNDLLAADDPQPEPKPEPEKPAQPKVERTAPPARRTREPKRPPRTDAKTSAGAA